MLPDDIMEANELMKDLEPSTPQEYILKGVVNAVLGQEQGTVSCYFNRYCATGSEQEMISIGHSGSIQS